MPRDDRSYVDPKALHILVTLASGPAHGYAVRQEVEARTGGAIRLWPATLYGLLADLSSEGLIQESAAPGSEDDDPRRRYWALTPAGRRVLSAEAARLEALARLAQSRLRRRTT